MPSQLFEDILSLLDGQLTVPEDDFDTARQKMEAVHGHPIQEDTLLQWLDIGGVRCARVVAQGVSSATTLLYFRGGAFIAAGGDGFVFYAEMLSRLFDCEVIMVDYRLLPHHPYPAALDDCCNAYIGLLENNTSASYISFIGDSCGGGLVVSCLLKLRDDGVPLPACGICLCGWFDLALDSDDRDPLYHQGYTHQRGLDYIGANIMGANSIGSNIVDTSTNTSVSTNREVNEEQLKNPLVSPLYGEFQQLPALLIQSGEIDPTHDQAKALATKASLDGVDVTLQISPDMIHGFHGFANFGVPESLEAFRQAKLFLDRHV